MNAMTEATQPGLRGRITALEAVELGGLGLLLTILSTLASLDDGVGVGNVLAALVVIEGAIFLAWGAYNLFIFLARAGGPRVDVGLWVIASAATASAAFWVWTVLDINRLILAKLFYRGEAPVEYAWSSKSKRIRKEWETARKTA
jgi:hypothetical protein